MLWLNLSNIVKGVDYCSSVYETTKSEAIHLLGNSVLEDREYILKKSKLKVESATIILTI